MRKVDGEDEDIQDTKHNTLVLVMIGMVIALLLCVVSILSFSCWSEGHGVNTALGLQLHSATWETL